MRRNYRRNPEPITMLLLLGVAGAGVYMVTRKAQAAKPTKPKSMLAPVIPYSVQSIAPIQPVQPVPIAAAPAPAPDGYLSTFQQGLALLHQRAQAQAQSLPAQPAQAPMPSAPSAQAIVQQAATQAVVQKLMASGMERAIAEDMAGDFVPQVVQQVMRNPSLVQQIVSNPQNGANVILSSGIIK